MAALTAQEITAELQQAWIEGEPHGETCDCCERHTPENPGLMHLLTWEAYYAIDRYRPGEGTGLDPVLMNVTDETDESIDELAGAMADAALVAVHETMTRMAADALAGRIARVAAA